MNNITLGIIKFIGFFAIWWAIPFRAYARSVVYNYVLLNNKREWLSRLWQRKPKVSAKYLDVHGWDLLNENNSIHGKQLKYDGFIAYRKVNKYQFWFILVTVWIFLDDDANEDTTDLGYIKTWIDGERKDYFIAPIVRWLVRKVNFNQVYGNSFDLGDIRAEHKFSNKWCTLLWNTRNLSMNYQYMFRGY